MEIVEFEVLEELDALPAEETVGLGNCSWTCYWTCAFTSLAA